MNGFRMDPDRVRQHAAEVAEVAGNADTAAQAAAHLADLNDAYGLFCQPFAMMLKGPQEIGAQFLQISADELHRMNRDLEESAKTTEEIDRDQASKIEKLFSQFQ
ncbi:type VII secretion target [Saccharopolyspora sp. NPDC000359]|uniref:type VII secretion target n=1 Tax=Saccharopolyspora sp. NPDC000359 TaxID=3154251 RepID=UPI003326472B